MATGFRNLGEQNARDDAHEVVVQPAGNVAPKRLAISRLIAGLARSADVPSSFADLTGEVADSQIPASISRDSERVTAIQNAIAALVAGAPANRDTLKELSDAIAAVVPGISQANADLRYLMLAGGVLTGALTLSGAPTADLHAATKKYVDDNAGGGDGGGPVGYSFYAAPALAAVADIAYDSSNTANQISASSDYEITLVNAASVAGAVKAGRDFVTEWFGVLSIALHANRHLEAEMETTHVFNGKTIVHRRPLGVVRVIQNAAVAIDLNRANSRSRVHVGDYTDANGDTVTIAEADLAGPATITYKLLLRTYNANNPETRQSGNIVFMELRGAKTVSYQIGPQPDTPVTPADDFLFGTSADAVPVAGELTIPAANGSAEIAAYAGSKHVLLARLASEADITSVTRSDDLSQTNQIGAFTKHGSAIDVGGTDYSVWVSNQALTQSAAVTWTAR